MYTCFVVALYSIGSFNIIACMLSFSNSTSVSKWNMENYISFGTDLALHYVIYLWKCFVIHITITVVSEALVIYIIYL